jgi:hypothetical protein
MSSFFFSIVFFIVGFGAALLFVKSGKSLKQKQEVNRLESRIKDQNINSAEKNKEVKELSETVAILSSQVITCLEILSRITKIQEQTEDIDAQILITKRCFKKYERFLDPDVYRSN